jgi:hypothetical protein
MKFWLNGPENAVRRMWLSLQHLSISPELARAEDTSFCKTARYRIKIRLPSPFFSPFDPR